MAKKNQRKHRYSAAERKAYYMAYGAGVCGVDVNSVNAIDSCLILLEHSTRILTFMKRTITNFLRM